MLLGELSLVYNWILAPEPILETAGGSGRGRCVIHPEPFLGTLRVTQSSGDRAGRASCRRSPAQTFTLPSLEPIDRKDLGLLPADIHPHCSGVLRLGGPSLTPGTAWTPYTGLLGWSGGVLPWMHPQKSSEDLVSRKCSLAPNLLQQELCLTARGTSGTYQPIGCYVSAIVFGETWKLSEASSVLALLSPAARCPRS